MNSDSIIIYSKIEAHFISVRAQRYAVAIEVR